MNKTNEMNEMNEMYFRVDSARIAELRKVADMLNTSDLLALTMMWGLRKIQEMNINLVSGGELLPKQVDQTEDGMALLASEMTCDIITPDDLCESARINDLGDYSVKFVTKVVGVRKSV